MATKCEEPGGCNAEGGVFTLTKRGWRCQSHRYGPVVRDTAKGFQEFTTTHIDGKGTPIAVKSLRQLRQLENRYGVASAPYNFNSNNLERG